jgi:O-antigen/teichoic acid export membrane protein
VIARLQQPSRSDFARGVAMLSGGQIVTMALPILAAPVLGRLYSPADYGFLALYMSVASVLAVTVTLQYHMAIIAEPGARQARALVYLCIILAAIFAVPAALGAWMLWATWLDAPVYHAARGWIALLPFSVLLNGLIAGTATLGNRHKRYKALATIPVISICANLSISLFLGFLGWGVHGLFLSYLAGQLAQALAYGRLWIALAGRPRLPGLVRLRVLARRHRNFPRYSLPGAFLSNVNMQLPVFALGAIGAADTLGQFSRARQLVSMPITLFGSAVAKVYRQEGAERYRQTGSCKPLLLRTAGVLFFAGILPCLGFMTVAPQLFALYLGEPWREAGVLAQILAPMLLLRMVSSPIATTFFFTGHQRLSFLLSLVSTLMVGGALLAALLLALPVQQIVMAYSAATATVYVLYFLFALRISRKR